LEEKPKRPFVSLELEGELAALIRKGKTVSAIKRLREATGAGLLEAKVWVEEYIHTHYRK
jgi:ribosomal protein L7/L12